MNSKVSTNALRSVKRKLNGVDKNGVPLYFTSDMLKPFMRAVTRESVVYLAAEDVQESQGFIFIKNGGWIPFVEESESAIEEFDIMAIYEAPPYNCDLLDTRELGELVWKRVEEKSSVQVEIEALEKTVSEITERLDELKGE